MLAETSHNTPFVNVNGIFRLNLAILALPDIKVLINCLRRERVKPFGFLASTYLSLQVYAALNKSGHPIASQLGIFSLLSQQAYNASADLIMGRSIAQGFLTEYPESQPILLILGQTSARVNLLFHSSPAVKSID